MKVTGHSLNSYDEDKAFLFIHCRAETRALTARCPSLDPYTVIASLTFGIFLFYLFRVLFPTIGVNQGRRSSLRVKKNAETQRIYSCLLRGNALWQC